MFTQMLAVLRKSEAQKKRSGRPSKLFLADQLMLTLMYWREYRTQFHIAKSYSLHPKVIRRLKVFRILAERYRGRRKRFGLRFNLIAGLYNLELALST